MKILLIEDEGRIANLIKTGLEGQGYRTTLASDGSMGRKRALSNNFDLIITDILLPKINGIDLCKEIRLRFPDIPIIMLTALGTTDDKVEGFDAGANDYLVKPFDLRELEARIKVLIKKSQHTKQSTITRLLKIADLLMDTHTKIVTRRGVELNLTPKE